MITLGILLHLLLYWVDHQVHYHSEVQRASLSVSYVHLTAVCCVCI